MGTTLPLTKRQKSNARRCLLIHRLTSTHIVGLLTGRYHWSRSRMDHPCLSAHLHVTSRLMFSFCPVITSGRHQTGYCPLDYAVWGNTHMFGSVPFPPSFTAVSLPHFLLRLPMLKNMITATTRQSYASHFICFQSCIICPLVTISSSFPLPSVRPLFDFKHSHLRLRHCGHYLHRCRHFIPHASLRPSRLLLLPSQSRTTSLPL